jgi:hypothetical protein
MECHRLGPVINQQALQPHIAMLHASQQLAVPSAAVTAAPVLLGLVTRLKLLACGTLCTVEGEQSLLHATPQSAMLG